MERRRLVIIETEGNPQDLAYELRIRVPPDLYLFWNDAMADLYRPQLESAGTTTAVVGFGRSDFLHPRLDAVFPSREALLSGYGLDPSRRTLTVATSSQDAHFSQERVRDKRRRRSRSFARTAEYLDIVANMRQLRDTTVELVRGVVNRYPDLNVALKPHPHENTVFWADFIQELDRPNVTLIVGEPINHLLRVSDLHLAYNVCTTTVEALLAGVPVVELHTERSASLYGERHLALPTYQIRNVDTLAAVLEAEVAGEPARLHQSAANVAKLHDYVRTCFHAFDGRRCEAYARVFADWAGSLGVPGGGWSYLGRHPRQGLLYAGVRGMAVVRRAARSRQRELIAKVNAPRPDEDRSVRRINGVVVDEEFGLFDNRMKPGDEQVWIDRYRRAGLLDAVETTPDPTGA
jgi:surface carbohydrate biosynthesis protein